MNNHIQPSARYVPETGLRTFKSESIPQELVLIPGKHKKFRNKRIFDLAFSFLVIVLLLSWLLPILAIFILIDSRGPVFFIQKRVGAFGKTFRCLKLRTMVVNEEANLKQAQANDPRITSFGKFLRFSCLDELPQFFNVFLGHMSIVGPRPHMLSDCREFSSVVKDYHHRNFVKPGITGMAQVKGYRGKTSSFFDVAHRYKWDMFYVNNCSLNLDLLIFKLTIIATVCAMCAFAGLKERKIAEVNFQLDQPEYLN